MSEDDLMGDIDGVGGDLEEDPKDKKLTDAEKRAKAIDDEKESKEKWE